jgi:rod shape determining protein RodA
MPIVISLLLAFSLAFIVSASGGLTVDAYYWQKQLVWATFGFAIFFLISRVHYRVFLERAHWIYYIGIALLLLLWVPHVGEVREGSRRWLNLGPILSFQPVEVAKIGTLLMVCSILARSEVGSFRDSLIALLKVTITVMIPFVLIFAQPDLGSAMVLPPMTLALLYASNLTTRFFRVVAIVSVVLIGLVAWDLSRYVNFVQENNLSFNDPDNHGTYEKHEILPLKDYQRNRILVFVSPDVVDPHGIGASWNQRQSLITVGSGGFFGKGWKEGTQARLGYLPSTVAHNDFIFSVIAEETGFVGAVLVLGLLAILVVMTLITASRASDRFGRLLAVGVGVILMTHIFVNIAMTIGLMPIKGIPLPFVSYGGSFLLGAFVLTGMVASVEKFRLSRAP